MPLQEIVVYFKPIYLLFVYLAVVNIITFFLYAIDKHKAKKNKWRIPEKTLIAWAFLGGALGALLGMLLCHHKTLHKKFTTLVPLALLLWMCILALLYVL